MNDLRTLITEPSCCDEPMVHNSYEARWECADAYFALLDEGLLVDNGGGRLRGTVGDLNVEQRLAYFHWLNSFAPYEPA